MSTEHHDIMACTRQPWQPQQLSILTEDSISMCCLWCSSHVKRWLNNIAILPCIRLLASTAAVMWKGGRTNDIALPTYPACNDTCERGNQSPFVPPVQTICAKNTWSSCPSYPKEIQACKLLWQIYLSLCRFFVAAAKKGTYLISGFRIFTTWPNTCKCILCRLIQRRHVLRKINCRALNITRCAAFWWLAFWESLSISKWGGGCHLLSQTFSL